MRSKEEIRQEEIATLHELAQVYRDHAVFYSDLETLCLSGAMEPPPVYEGQLKESLDMAKRRDVLDARKYEVNAKLQRIGIEKSQLMPKPSEEDRGF